MFSLLRTKLYWVILLPTILLSVLRVTPPDQNWQLIEEQLLPVPQSQLPINSGRVAPLLTGDLDGDKQPECLIFEGETLQITDCAGQIFWQSPPEWRVSEALIADMDHDERREVMLLVWRAFQPWPADQFMPFGGRIESHQDREGQSCQVILIGWQKDGYREIWAGSALANPISNILAADLDGDGLLELAALESDYNSNREGGQLTVWRWIGFGFSLLDRSVSRWQRLAIKGDGVHYWLFTR